MYCQIRTWLCTCIFSFSSIFSEVSECYTALIDNKVVRLKSIIETALLSLWTVTNNNVITLRCRERNTPSLLLNTCFLTPQGNKWALSHTILPGDCLLALLYSFLHSHNISLGFAYGTFQKHELPLRIVFYVSQGFFSWQIFRSIITSSRVWQPNCLREIHKN